MTKKQKYPKREIRVGNEWIVVDKASKLIKDGWLHYELRDGTNGLAQPKNWREVK